MNLLYISCLCSKDKYQKLFGNSRYKPGQQVQKYHRLITDGLLHDKSVNLCVLSSLPVTAQNSDKFYMPKEIEIINNIKYTYLPIVNLTIVKNLVVFIGSFLATCIFCLRNKNTTIICDALNISVTSGALFASKLLKVNSIGIVTDVPTFLSVKKKSLTVRINNYIINLFNSYIFLTNYMNSLINKKNKPFLVIEGQVDAEMLNSINQLDDKYSINTCIYAGGIQREYGVETLVKGFIKAAVQNSELHIYGDGSYAEELNKVCLLHNNIKYFGVRLNDYVINEQLKAVLLINPRPSSEEFTKYSFPSKNMEYMVSGTPVLTTKLPGMPEEYNDFVYLIEEETIDGLAKNLKNILNKSREELHEKGQRAKEFVLKNKNNVIQAGKIVKLIKTQFHDSK